MKTKIFFGILFVALLSLAACNKNEKVAFTHSTMKPWFETHCKSCHGSGGANTSAWKYEDSDYEGSIKGKIAKLYEVVYTKKSMPVGKTLTQTELDAFKAWYDAGYPAK